MLAVNIYIERSREAHCQSRSDLLKAGGGAGGSGGSGPSAILRLPSYRFRYRRRSRSSSRSSEPSPSRDASPGGAGGPVSLNFWLKNTPSCLSMELPPEDPRRLA